MENFNLTIEKCAHNVYSNGKCENLTKHSSGYMRFIGISLYSYSYLTDILSIYLIYASRSQLKTIEVIILEVSQILILAHKLCSIFIFVFLYFGAYVFGHWTCLTIYPITFSISTIFNFVLIYYALCHYSSIQRTGHYLVLYNFTQNIRNFIVYITVVVILAFGLIEWIFNAYRNDVFFETKHKCKLRERSSSALVLVSITNFPLIFVLVTYSISIVKLLINSKSNEVTSSVEMIRYRKSFKLALKLMSFTIVPLFSCVARFSFVFFAQLCPNCKHHIFDLIQFITTLTFLIEPTVIIFIHNVLYKQFLNFILKFLPSSLSSS